MKQNDPADAKSIGAFLSDDRFPVRKLLTEAQRLEALQTCLREWASRPARAAVDSPAAAWGSSLRIAAERNAELVIHSDSAAALTELRYRQDELLQYLRQRCPISATKIVTKIVPKC